MINFEYNLRNKGLKFVGIPKFKIFNKSGFELLKKNARFENIHKGKKCFVVGNGPSLRKQDLSLLANEYVFTVNQLNRLPEFEQLKSNYHFIADPVFFRLEENKQEEMEVIQFMKEIRTNDNIPTCFFPLGAMSFIKKHKFEEVLPVNYFEARYSFTENYSDSINFTRFVPAFSTVVHYAIIMAIYMGFEEIYLLGCDMTGHLNLKAEEIELEDEQFYAYTFSENEKKWMANLKKEISCEATFNGFANMFTHYRRLKKYCDIQNVKLINATEGGILDSLPKKRLKDVLKG